LTGVTTTPVTSPFTAFRCCDPIVFRAARGERHRRGSPAHPSGEPVHRPGFPVHPQRHPVGVPDVPEAPPDAAALAAMRALFQQGGSRAVVVAVLASAEYYALS
jgi:hypothetical protein